MLSGDNNILGRTTTSKEKTESVQIVENTRIDKAGEIANNKWVYDHTAQTVTNGNLTLKIGDYVNDTGTQTVEGFDGKWRVLGVENGQLLLVSATYYAPFTENSSKGIKRAITADVPGLYGAQLEGADGWNNGMDILDAIGEQYNNSKLEKGRSIKVEDVNRITGYNPKNTGVNDPNQTGTGTSYGNGNVWQYLNNVTYTLEGGKVWYQGDKAVTTKTQGTYTSFKPIGQAENITAQFPIQSTYYYYNATTLSEISDNSATKGIAINSPAYDMLFKIQAAYWLASPCLGADQGRVDWLMFFAYCGGVNVCSLCNSNSGSYNYDFGVRTAVSLKSNITPTFVSTDSTTGISTYTI